MIEIKFLKERAKEFFTNAEELFKKKKYNLCVFNLEQALQLWIKYLIAKRIGDWPKTHYLDELIIELAKVYNNKKLLSFKKNNKIYIEDLTEAYFSSRYYPINFSKEKSENLIEKTKEFIKLTEKISKEQFYE